MTLENAKKLLSERNIPFIETVYESEKEYWTKSDDFKTGDIKNAREIKVATLVITSNNKRKNLLLQFFEKNNQLEFNDLLFGSFSFEMFDYKPDMLADDLMHCIEFVMSGNAKVLEAYNKSKRISALWIFDMSVDEDVADLNNTLVRIEKRKNIFKGLFSAKRYYDIYDWNTCIRIVK